MVLTSHDELGDTGNETGFWLEELAAPYYAFVDAGAEVTLASPAGGRPPLDPSSDEDDAQTEATERFKSDTEAQNRLDSTTQLADIDPADYDAVFFPGGHGPMWDLATSETAAKLLSHFFDDGKPVGAVCHGPAVFTSLPPQDARKYLGDKTLTAFTNTEEAAVGLADVVPFSLADELREVAAGFEHGKNWESFVIMDDNLVTGQNPASSAPAAHALLELLDVTSN
jgi:putative intracellular protease/amidase